MNKRILFAIVLIVPNMLKSQHFGTKDHVMHKETPNMEVLSYWNNVSAEDTELYTSAFEVLSANKEASYDDLITNEAYTKLIGRYSKQIIGGPMLGAVSKNSISIWIRTAKPAKIAIAFTDTITGKSKLSEASDSKVESDLSAVIAISNLKPATYYTYKVILDDTLVVSNKHYFFRTVSENKVRIAFGSCPHRWGLGNSQLFATIKKRKPTAMLLLGDIAVQDRNNHFGMHRADYLLRDFQTAWGNFASNVPVYASWDDHDYFANDKAGIPEGYSAEDRKGVRNIFKNSWVNPAYGINDEGIYFKTKIGLSEIIMTDNRYFRTGKDGSFLGDTQMAWLKKQIIDCQSPFLILSCGSMWSDFVSNGKDSWGVNDPEGREAIFKLIEERNISGVLFISGDRHGARGFTIQRNAGFDFYEFEAASLGARIGPPKTKSEWTSQLYGVDGTFAFGEFTFENTGNQKQLVFRLIKENGDILYRKKLTLNDLTPNNPIHKE